MKFLLKVEVAVYQAKEVMPKESKSKIIISSGMKV